MISLSPYTSASSMFANVNSADCGGFTACSLKPQGCGSGAYTGKLAMHAGTFAITAKQNEPMGYNELQCVEC